MKKKNTLGKQLKKETDSLKSEKIWENGIRTVVVVRNFTHPIAVAFDKKGRHFDALSFLLSYKNNDQFVKNLWMCWVKIYILYSYQNAFDVLLKI